MSSWTFGLSPYVNHPFATGYLDMEGEVLLGSEFWDLLGGAGCGLSFPLGVLASIPAGYRQPIVATLKDTVMR